MAISQIWTLEYLGVTAAGTGGGNNGGNPVTGTPVTKTLAAWGITGCEITRLSQAADKCLLKFDGAAFDAAEIFAWRSILTIKRDGVPWFQGVVTKTPKYGRPSAEGLQYEVSGPWWWLEQVVYQQYWYLFPPEGGTEPSPLPQSQVILFCGSDGALIDTGAQITAAWNFAKNANLPLQLGAVGVEFAVPDEPARDVTIAEVFRRALRWHPDVVTWMDYTTSPPTLNIQPRSAVAAAGLPCVGAPCQEFEITPRYDLQRSCISIHYKQVNSFNGQQQLIETIDQYPADASEVQAFAAIMSCDLAGNRTTWLEQPITAPGLDATSLTWWKSKLPQLNDKAITNLSIEAGSSLIINASGSSDDPTYSNELQAGAIASWMSGVEVADTNVSALFDYDETMPDGDGNTIVNHVRGKLLAVRIKTTSATTQTYHSIGNISLGDPLPAPGLAFDFWNLLNQLQYEGALTLIEDEVGDSGGPFSGQVLNLTGGRTEWSTMGAQIFSVREDIAKGTTMITFGPTKHLSVANMVAHLRALRDREDSELLELLTGSLTGGAQTLPDEHVKKRARMARARPPPTMFIPAPAAPAGARRRAHPWPPSNPPASITFPTPAPSPPARLFRWPTFSS
jgi:hypothetical protein